MHKFCAALIAFGLSIITLIAEAEGTLHDTSCTFIHPHESGEIANCCHPCQEYTPPITYHESPLPTCCSHFYVGIEGGWSTGLGHANKSRGVGGFFTGIAEGPRADSGYNVGASLGYRWNCLLRTDLSYTYLHPNHYNCNTFFPNPDQTDLFKAHLHSHLILLNTYMHLNAVYCLLPWIDPYITGGVGVAVNRMDDIREFASGEESFFAKIHSYTHTNFGARVGVGVMKYFCHCWILDLGFNANYIGRVRSDNSRTFIARGTSQPIGKYDFKNNWIGTFYLGLKYAF